MYFFFSLLSWSISPFLCWITLFWGLSSPFLVTFFLLLPLFFLPPLFNLSPPYLLLFIFNLSLPLFSHHMSYLLWFSLLGLGRYSRVEASSVSTCFNPIWPWPVVIGYDNFLESTDTKPCPVSFLYLFFPLFVIFFF